MKNSIPVITIDGPSGSGKGTIAQRLAQQLGWHYLDSGALYRVLALAANRHQITPDNANALAILAEHLDLQFETSKKLGKPRILLEGQDVTGAIRCESVGTLASKISAFQEVRVALLLRQQIFCQAPGLVTDGRDMGTVVFPDAPLKFYLLANCEERAQRRYKQLKAQGNDVKLAALLQELAERDRRDVERTISPLKPAHNAIIIDTSEMNIEDVMARVMKEVELAGLS